MNLHLAKYLDRYFGILLCYLLAALHLFREMISPLETTIRVRRILLVKFWGIGNIVLLLPIIRLIRRRYPRARIEFLTLDRNRQLLEGNADLDRVWTVTATNIPDLTLSLLRTFSGLRSTRFDLFLDFEQFARTSALLGYLLGAPQRVGLRTPGQGRDVLYTAPVRYRNDQHMSQTFLDIARAAGVREERYEPSPVPFTPEEAERTRTLLGAVTGPVVLMHVGSGDNFPGRRWPGESFARLADLLVERHGAVPVFSGARSEAFLVNSVVSLMRWRASARVLVGRLTIRELAALTRMATLVVSNDTGPVHIATSLSVPVLGIYGPNTPVLYGPLSPGSRSFYKALPCSPCITNLNYKTSFCRLPVCVMNIEVNEVLSAAGHLLSGRGEEVAGVAS